MIRVAAVMLALGLGAWAQQLVLHTGWDVQSSAVVTANGAEISTPGHATAGWYPVSVPSTVFNALVVNHAVPDPDYGMNLRQAPGTSYKIGANFSHEEIPADSPYAVPWWFRTEFTLPTDDSGKTLWLDFHGINYRADIWLNGREIAGADEAQGTFRRFEFNVTGVAHAGKNALAVEVYAPRVHDLAITFVDWNPMPPDKDMGLWGAVAVRASGPVALRNAWVETRLPLPSTDTAHLTVRTEVISASDQPQRGELTGTVAGQAVRREVALGPHADEVEQFQLDVAHPRLWWPNGMGAPTLQDLNLRWVETGGGVSDRVEQAFGMDEITAERNAQGNEQFLVNGKKLYVRGGGWTPDMLLRQARPALSGGSAPDASRWSAPPQSLSREDAATWQDDFNYARELGFNALRLEGKLMDDAFFDQADRSGILIMAGWCCCDHWEEWPQWKDDEGYVADASLRNQAERLRGHASVLVWLDGSDNPPPAEVERSYLQVLAESQWPKPTLSSASAKKAAFSGPSGVKMNGPYDYVPPNYWLEEPQEGGAEGFDTEVGPGAAIPPVESLEQFIPADHLWTGTGPGQGSEDPFWSFHASSGQFSNLKRYDAALGARYGAATSLEDYDWKSQAAAYEGERAMFEAFGRRQGVATGVIQWMMNNGWPGLFWHLYDYYLRPGAGFYGVERANEPVHVQYSDSDRAVSVVNHTLQAAGAGTVTVRVVDLSGAARMTRTVPSAAVASESSADVFRLPNFNADEFLELTLRSPAGAEVSRNFYWLSAKPDVMDVKANTWFYMPESSYADFSPLARLPQVTIHATATFSKTGTGEVRISNPSPQAALLVRLRVLRGASGSEVLPVYWQDNYISLLPGEARRVRVRFAAAELDGAQPVLAVDGWNIAASRGASN